MPTLVIKLTILQHLLDVKDLCAVSCVNSAWKSVAGNDDSISVKMDFSRFSKGLQGHNLDLIMTRFPLKAGISQNAIYINFLYHLFVAWRLTELNVQGLSLSQEILFEILKKCTNLESLTLGQYSPKQSRFLYRFHVHDHPASSKNKKRKLPNDILLPRLKSLCM